jgi:hypothetical protein
LAPNSSTIRVHLTFDRVGISSIGLLPERTAGLDNELPVKLGGKPFLLLGPDDWYEDIYPEEIGVYLRNGVELKVVLAGERRVRWLLSGRDLYVLASSKLARGFVSTNRLALGRSHVVLCGAELLEKAEALLNEAGCQTITIARESYFEDNGESGSNPSWPENGLCVEVAYRQCCQNGPARVSVPANTPACISSCAMPMLVESLYVLRHESRNL